MKTRHLSTWFTTIAALAGITRDELMDLPVAEVLARLRRRVVH